MGDCLRKGKPSWYITNTKVNSAFYPSRVGKSSTSLSVESWPGVFTCVEWPVTLLDPVWQMKLRISEMGFLRRTIPFNQLNRSHPTHLGSSWALLTLAGELSSRHVMMWLIIASTTDSCSTDRGRRTMTANRSNSLTTHINTQSINTNYLSMKPQVNKYVNKQINVRVKQ